MKKTKRTHETVLHGVPHHNPHIDYFKMNERNLRAYWRVIRMVANDL